MEAQQGLHLNVSITNSIADSIFKTMGSAYLIRVWPAKSLFCIPVAACVRAPVPVLPKNVQGHQIAEFFEESPIRIAFTLFVKVFWHGNYGAKGGEACLTCAERLPADQIY